MQFLVWPHFWGVTKMILPDRKLIVLEIPKTGSRSVVWALKRNNKNIFYGGHAKLSKLLQRIEENKDNPWEYKAIGVVREPLERLVSGLNYESTKGSKFVLQQRLQRILDGKQDPVYSRQSDFVDVPDFPVDLYPLYQIDKVLSIVGYDSPVHENKSVKRFTQQDIIDCPLYEDLMNYYQPDFDLYEQVTRHSSRSEVSF